MSKCKVDPTTCSVVEGYHSRKQTNYITDLDKNIAYGWTLSLPLPKSDFKRLASVGVLLRRATGAVYYLFSNRDFKMPYFVIFCETGIITRINC